MFAGIINTIGEQNNYFALYSKAVFFAIEVKIDNLVVEMVNLRMLPFQTKRTAVLMSRLASREGS